MPAAEIAELARPVAGMTCASCVRRVEKAPERVDGVQLDGVAWPTVPAR